MPPTSADLASQIIAYTANPTTATDALNSALTQYGVPEIRNTVSGLRTTLANTTNAYNNVDPSVTGRTQGSLVTEAQRQAQVSNEEAPIAANITSETGALNQNQQDLTDAEGQATTEANNKVSDYQSGLAALQDQYTDAYQREQDTAAAQLAAQEDAEKTREFNVGASQSAASLAAGTSAGTGTSTPTTPSAQAEQRTGGGFNFQSATGAPINAVQYSQAKQIPIRTQLQGMANEGDKGAATALDYVGNDFGVNKQKLQSLEVAPATYNATVSLLRSLGFNV